MYVWNPEFQRFDVHLQIEDLDQWDEVTEQFCILPAVNVILSHTLVTISKWESIYQKPYCSAREKLTPEESAAYIECMVQGDVPERLIDRLTGAQLDEIEKYISDPMSATVINRGKGKKKSRPKNITSEDIYSWMFHYRIDRRCEEWHLNRLLKLIETCQFNESEGDGKESEQETRARHRALNEQRRAKYAAKRH